LTYKCYFLLPGIFGRHIVFFPEILYYLEKFEGVHLARKAKKKYEDIEAYRHDAEKRKNAVPVGLASYDTSKPKPKKYDYDPHLDPQLVWSGKKEHTSFEVLTVLLHIDERINMEQGAWP
jgi:hypothetical protein